MTMTYTLVVIVIYLAMNSLAEGDIAQPNFRTYNQKFLWVFYQFVVEMGSDIVVLYFHLLKNIM